MNHQVRRPARVVPPQPEPARTPRVQEDAIRQHAARLSLAEIEHAMIESSGLAATCRMMNVDTLADLHIGWMDILLDEWAARVRPRSAHCP